MAAAVPEAQQPQAGTGEQGAPSVAGLRALGVLLFLAGLVGGIYFATFYDTSVKTETVEILGQRFGGERVHNIGLMQQRQLGLFGSGATGLLGFVILLYTEYGPGRRQQPAP